MGAAQTVAMDTPVNTSDIARGKSRSGTRRMASAAAIDQKPPSAMPSTTRANSSTASEAAVAASRLDTSKRAVSVSSTRLRSKRAVSKRDGRRGHRTDERRGRDGLARSARRDMEIGRHGGQQAGRQEFRRDQAEHAEGK
jgi:hypothetical protein